jgi:hypothetical protein
MKDTRSNHAARRRAGGRKNTGDGKFRYLVGATAAAVLATPVVARIEPFPAAFHTQMIQSNGTTLYVRVGGHGPAVVLLHGFGDTGDMWAPLAAVLVKDHTVIVPDLRGMGLSAHPDTGYTKKNQAVDIAGVMDALKVQKADLAMKSGWCRDVSVSISTASGTSCRQIRGGSTRRRASTTPVSTRSRTPFTTHSSSSARSIRMRSTTRRCSPRAAASLSFLRVFEHADDAEGA